MPVIWSCFLTRMTINIQVVVSLTERCLKCINSRNGKAFSGVISLKKIVQFTNICPSIYLFIFKVIFKNVLQQKIADKLLLLAQISRKWYDFRGPYKSIVLISCNMDSISRELLLISFRYKQLL